MPCSHCRGRSHNIKTCPNLSQEEKENKINENKEKKQMAQERRRLVQERYQQEMEAERKRKEEEQKQMITYEVINNTQHELALYWGWNGTCNFRHFTYVPNNSSKTFRCNKEKHQVCFFHSLEVMDPSTNEVRKDICIGPNNNPEYAFKQVMKDYSGTIIIIDKEYVPKKTELDKWKESSLKANFLLEQIIKMGGKTYENLEPMLDMVEDIKVPNHSDYDRELAGVPSKLTNIT
jgi:hypothetical protein